MKKAGLVAFAIAFGLGASALITVPASASDGGASQGCFGEADPLLPGTWQIEDQPRFESAAGDQQPDRSGRPQDESLSSDCALV